MIRKKRKLPLSGKFDETRVKIILQAVEAGHGRTVTAALAGVALNTLEKWIAAGRAGKSPEHAEFFKRLVHAQSLGLKKDLAVIDRCAEGETVEEVKETFDPAGCLLSRIVTKRKLPGSWQAKVWKITALQRCFPECFDIHEKGMLDDKTDDPVVINYIEEKD
jgi:hypothetical protein